MIRKLALTVVLLFTLIGLTEAEKTSGNFVYKGFSGGMMLHTGYVYGGRTQLYDMQNTALTVEEMRGMPSGLGGAIRFHFGDHWRFGSEGYSTGLNYGINHSAISIGWGGALVDYLWGSGKFRPFTGITLGGGSVKNLTLLQDSPLDFITEQAASYRSYPFMALCPFMGLEYSLTQKIHLICKIDYLMNVSSPQEDFVRGPRFYLGFMFYRINP